MAGKHPIYAFEYDIDIHKIEKGLEHFIDKINEKNQAYRREHLGFEYDIIHFEVLKDPKDNIFMISIKLFYTYSSLRLTFLQELIQDHCSGKYLSRRIT